MLCARPFRSAERRVEFPCGQCLCCRINKRREWTTRIMLEMRHHTNTEWVTLTYNRESLPPGGTLVPSHLSSWIRGVRQRIRRRYGYQIRFFGVGEYGSQFGRPHYHVFLFGLLPQHRAEAEQVWRYGHVMWAHDPMNSKIAEYTAGYTVKKEGKDSEKLGGKSPEFSRMSLRPPIGAAWAEKFGESLAENQYAIESVAKEGDAPAAVRIGGKLVPLGRTLRRYVRRGLGWELELPEHIKQQQAWIRTQIFVDPRVQSIREQARAKGHQRAIGRQKVFGKQEKF